jgi:hypothetical protein
MMPTAEQLKTYAEKLPAVYREILAAFPEAVPNRQSEEGLSIEVIQLHLIRRNQQYTLEEIEAAIDQLEDGGFVAVVNEDYLRIVRPTVLGEGLITAITGKAPKNQLVVPALPKPTW